MSVATARTALPGGIRRDGTLLQISGLQVRYEIEPVAAVQEVSLTVRPGELVGVVGESGSGKTTVVRAALGVLPFNATVVSGQIAYGGADVTHWRDRQLARVRGPFVGYVPQDPATSLNPVKKIGRQVAEGILLHDRRLKAPEVRELALGKLVTAGLTEAERVYDQYPHELSGGMKQRALIAIALASDPALLIADEPTSALDVTVQKAILDHLDQLRARFNLGVLLVTHDLGIATERASRLVVMQRGRVVEELLVGKEAPAPQHPYTRRLIAAAPSVRSARLQPAGPTGPTGPAEARAARDPEAADILVVDQVSKHYRIGHGRGAANFAAVASASFAVARGTTHAIVGESGAGKTTIARLAVGLQTPDSGTIRFEGADTTSLSAAARREFRRRVQFVYQNPFSSLDPSFSVGRLLAEPLQVHQVLSGDGLRQRVRELVTAVRLDHSYLSRRPAELSGGQAQRVAIARALALNPQLVVLDEPVSSLDVSVQGQVLQLLVDLQARHGLTYLFISHDLGVVRLIADTVSVMRRGQVVEDGPVSRIFADPRDPYTRTLIGAIPGPSGGSQWHASYT
ncbi:MAG: ABC transporter ATP-binding protein [Actinobacteria bacterium]|nr:ABC transporter ATP-binding protein [Actinomycetota bacterium]